jgi:hypothetical protein
MPQHRVVIRRDQALLKDLARFRSVRSETEARKGLPDLSLGNGQFPEHRRAHGGSRGPHAATQWTELRLYPYARRFVRFVAPR